MIHCKRVYEPVEPGDGQRLLVDRLWPRHWRKDQLHGQWVAQVAPSDALRKALHQGELDFPTFAARYRQELAAQPARWYFILDLAAKGPVTLLYASRDRQHNNALVLADFLEDEIERRGPGSSPVCYADRLA
ncbi:DUF488 domain-containing protein [Pseudomonas sp. Marseille-QA0332]